MNRPSGSSRGDWARRRSRRWLRYRSFTRCSIMPPRTASNPMRQLVASWPGGFRVSRLPCNRYLPASASEVCRATDTVPWRTRYRQRPPLRRAGQPRKDGLIARKGHHYLSRAILRPGAPAYSRPLPASLPRCAGHGGSGSNGKGAPPWGPCQTLRISLCLPNSHRSPCLA